MPLRVTPFVSQWRFWPSAQPTMLVSTRRSEYLPCTLEKKEAGAHGSVKGLAAVDGELGARARRGLGHGLADGDLRAAEGRVEHGLGGEGGEDRAEAGVCCQLRKWQPKLRRTLKVGGNVGEIGGGRGGGGGGEEEEGEHGGAVNECGCV